MASKVDLTELFYKQKGRCHWCGNPMDLGVVGDRQATREHIIPKSWGGTNIMKSGTGRKKRRIKNVVAACHKCNQARGNMSVHTFLSTYNP